MALRSLRVRERRSALTFGAVASAASLDLSSRDRPVDAVASLARIANQFGVASSLGRSLLCLGFTLTLVDVSFGSRPPRSGPCTCVRTSLRFHRHLSMVMSKRCAHRDASGSAR